MDDHIAAVVEGGYAAGFDIARTAAFLVHQEFGDFAPRAAVPGFVVAVVTLIARGRADASYAHLADVTLTANAPAGIIAAVRSFTCGQAAIAQEADRVEKFASGAILQR